MAGSTVAKIEGTNAIPNSFSLLSPKSASYEQKFVNRTYFLAAESPSSCADWIRKLQDVSRRSSVNSNINPVPLVNMPIAHVMEPTAPSARFSSDSNNSYSESSLNEALVLEMKNQIDALMKDKEELEDKLRAAQEETIAAVTHAVAAIQVTLDLAEREKGDLVYENRKLKEENQKVMIEQGKMQENIRKKEDELKKAKEEVEKLNVENRKLKENTLPGASDLERYNLDQLEVAEENFYQLLKQIRDRKVRKKGT